MFNSQVNQTLCIQLLEYFRQLPNLRGLSWQQPYLAFCDVEHWACETVKVIKALHNLDLISKIKELIGNNLFQPDVLPIPAKTGRFRWRTIQHSVSAPTAVPYTGHLYNVTRATAPEPLMQKKALEVCSSVVVDDDDDDADAPRDAASHSLADACSVVNAD